MHYEVFKNFNCGHRIDSYNRCHWCRRLLEPTGRFIRSREAEMKVDLNLDLYFVHKQGPNWIVEGVALLNNVGNVRLEFERINYELHYAQASDDFGWTNTEGEGAKEDIFRGRLIQGESLRPGLKAGGC
jgi:hypothetical protein